MEARIEELKDNGHAPTSQYDFLAGQMRDMQLDSIRVSLTYEIEKNNNRIDALDEKLTEQVKGTNVRIDSLETSLNTRIDATNTRIDDMKTIVDKTDKRISNMLIIFGIAFAGLFAVLGVILSKLG